MPRSLPGATPRRLRRATAAGLLTLALAASATAPLTGARGAPAAPVAATPAEADTLLAELIAAGNGATRVDTEPSTGAVSFVGFPAGTAWRPAGGGNPAAAGRQFLDRYSTLFGATPQNLRAGSPRPTPQGGSLIRVAQRHRGVPVTGAELVLQLDRSGGVITAAGKLVPTLELGTSATVAASTARASARDVAAKAWQTARAKVRAGQPRSTVFDPALHGRAATSRPVLAWEVPVRAPGAVPHAGAVYLDARTGATLATVEHVHTNLARIVCDNAGDAGRPSTCTNERAVRREGESAPINAQAQAAYDAMGAVYAFLRTRFGRDGIDGAGRVTKAVVRYCRVSGCPYRNAYWDGEDTIVFGDGFVADDVAYHELIHGFTDYTSKLVYLGEPGAINESMSDVFAEFIDLLTPGDGGDDTAFPWLIGEELAVLGGALRSMANPLTSRVPQPDSLISSKFLKVAAGTACGVANDFCGVHRNSGVGNKAAFLIAAGGAFNGQNVRALGVSKAAALYFATAGLLGPSSRYRDLGNALRQACQNLVGSAPTDASAVSADDCAQVEAAVTATAMVTGSGGVANRPPSAPDRTLTARKNKVAVIKLLPGASDPDGDQISFGSASNGRHGRVSCTPGGRCRYLPKAGRTGADAFTYTIRDGRGGVGQGTVRVSIAGKNKASQQKNKQKKQNKRVDAAAAGSGVRDVMTLVRTGAERYGIRGEFRSGDVDVVRRGGKIRAIRGSGVFADTLSVQVDLRVRQGKAFGVIRVRETSRGVDDRIRVSGARLVSRGEQVGATVRWAMRGSDQELVWQLQDRRR